MIVAARMFTGAVLIDVPAETPVEWVEAATQACQAALGVGRCVNERQASEVLWRAVISKAADGKTTLLTIELYDEKQQALESSRMLEFSNLDPIRQRWASAGVVVAAMVTAGEAGREAEEPIEIIPPEHVEPPLQEVPDDSLPVAVSAKIDRLWLDAGFELGPGLTASASLGGALRVTGRPLDGPLLVSLAGSATWSEGSASSRWLTFAAGGGARIVDATTVHWDVIAEILAQHYRVHSERGTAEAATETDFGARWRGGVAFGTILDWSFFSGARGFVLIDGRWLTPAVSVSSADEPIGQVSRLGWRALLGLRFPLLP